MKGAALIALEKLSERKEAAKHLREHLVMLKAHNVDEPVLYDVLNTACKAFDHNIDISPKDMFEIACYWCYVAIREGVMRESSDVIRILDIPELNRRMKAIAKNPRPGAKGKNLPEKNDLEDALDEFKNLMNKTHGAKAWIAAHLNISVSAINRAAEDFDIDELKKKKRK